MVLSLDSFMNDKHQHLPSHCLAANAQTSHVTCQEAERGSHFGLTSCNTLLELKAAISSMEFNCCS